MPWTPMDTLTQREDFIQDWLRRGFPMRGLCARYGIAPKPGSKWLHRFQVQGMSGLVDHPSVRQHQAHRTAPPVVKQLLHDKYTYPFWGPRTIHLALQRHPPGGPVPAVSTIGAMLKQHGLVKARKRNQRTPPHALWSADFKGQCKLGNGQSCSPLTVFDDYSRYLLACRGCAWPAKGVALATDDKSGLWRKVYICIAGPDQTDESDKCDKIREKLREQFQKTLREDNKKYSMEYWPTPAYTDMKNGPLNWNEEKCLATVADPKNAEELAEQ